MNIINLVILLINIPKFNLGIISVYNVLILIALIQSQQPPSGNTLQLTCVYLKNLGFFLVSLLSKDLTMPICIYCKKRKYDFKRREHVIPQAFGLFQPINFTLNDRTIKDKTVCDACNEKFGKDLEENLGCESYEGYILRSKFQNKPPRKSARSNIIIRASEGDYKGLYCKLDSNNKMVPLPQIGLKRKEGTWDYFLLDNTDKINKNLYDLSENSLRSFSLDEENVRAEFNKLNIKFELKGHLPPPDEKNILHEIEVSTNKSTFRLMAKIAFNYFSYFNYKYIILNQTFDPIRNYILDSNSSIIAPIRVSDEPILLEDDSSHRLLGHILTINKNNVGDILAQVSLFNYIKYTIMLSESFSHQKLKVGFGHFFNVNNGKILELGI